MVIALLMGGTACQKQNDSEIHDTVVIRTQLPVLKVEGGTDLVTIDATCDWTIECEDWFTIEPASGTKGVNESTITVQPNATGEARTGTVHLKAGSYSGTYKFTQAGK